MPIAFCRVQLLQAAPMCRGRPTHRPLSGPVQCAVQAADQVQAAAVVKAAVLPVQLGGYVAAAVQVGMHHALVAHGKGGGLLALPWHGKAYAFAAICQLAAGWRSVAVHQPLLQLGGNGERWPAGRNPAARPAGGRRSLRLRYGCRRGAPSSRSWLVSPTISVRAGCMPVCSQICSSMSGCGLLWHSSTVRVVTKRDCRPVLARAWFSRCGSCR